MIYYIICIVKWELSKVLTPSYTHSNKLSGS